MIAGLLSLIIYYSLQGFIISKMYSKIKSDPEEENNHIESLKGCNSICDLGNEMNNLLSEEKNFKEATKKIMTVLDQLIEKLDTNRILGEEDHNNQKD